MLVEYLKGIPLLKHFKELQLKEMASRCDMVKFNKSEVVFYMTTLSTDLYIVVSGKLKAVLVDEQGSELVLAHFKAGDFFGELSLLDGKGRSATIVSAEDSELAVLKREIFLDMLTKDSKMAVALITTLVERLRKADEMIESLAFLEVSERLMKALLEIARSDGEKCDGGVRIGRLTHRELAGRIGASREAVSKCMKELAAKGIVSETNTHISLAIKHPSSQ